MSNVNFENLRNTMVDRQLAARGISDTSVLAAMRKVPRHLFVPNGVVDRAYDDCALPIGENQTVSQPYMVALMTECCKLNKESYVYEIGTGSGYQTAVLAEICKKVVTIERIGHLYDLAKARLRTLNYTNVTCDHGDGTQNPAGQQQTFDAVMVTAGAPEKPEYLFSRLREAGRLVVPVGDRMNQMLMSYQKCDHEMIEEPVCGCTFVPLLGQHGWSLSS